VFKTRKNRGTKFPVQGGVFRKAVSGGEGSLLPLIREYTFNKVVSLRADPLRIRELIKEGRRDWTDRYGRKKKWLSAVRSWVIRVTLSNKPTNDIDFLIVRPGGARKKKNKVQDPSPSPGC
jgi:hypothetical protein